VLKNGYLFLVCLALAFSVWLIHNLSQSNVATVSVNVIAQSNIEGHADRSSDGATITARCQASGFRLLRLLRSQKKVRTVPFDAEDLHHKDGDYYTISANVLGRYNAAIFGQGINVEQFLQDDATFRFAAENNRRVPIKAVSVLNFRPQYTKVSGPNFTPDSVTIYGPPQMVNRVEEILTTPIVLNDIRSNVHSSVALEHPAGLRLSEDKVEYDLEVSRYVEVDSEVDITPINVPSNVDFSVFPSTVKVSLRCVFPLIADPTGFKCTVDYADFAKSKNGVCVINCKGMPDGVIDFSLDPPVAECVEIDAIQ